MAILGVRNRFRLIAVISFALTVCSFVTVSDQEPAFARGVDADRNNADRDISVRIGVLGLFHPQEFVVETIDGAALILRAGDEQVVLEKSSGPSSGSVRISDSGIALSVEARDFQANSVEVSGRNGEPADFILAIPGKIVRRYHGALELTPSEGRVLAVLTLDREAAVASIVAAEADPDTPAEALKAQAIATRSYLVAGRGRHRDFDFCDTTHCQFFREPPAPDSSVAMAVAATRGMVLAYNSQVFPAMYTRSCSGKTHTPAQVGLTTAAYPYYSVECAHCRAHPQRWTSRVSAEAASFLKNSDEASRLQIDRLLGWSAVPSNDFVTRKEGDEILLTGAGNGHGIGLCQAGAKAMAREGANFQAILKHYYPNTAVVIWNRSFDLARRN